MNETAKTSVANLTLRDYATQRLRDPSDVRIGVDFDNTIVCYDQVFHRVALERALIPQSLAANKGAIRDHLRRIGREDDWTEIQGYVYGRRMSDAEPFPGVLDFFRRMVARRTPISIISHKTRHPYKGPQYDLHAAALGWLELYGFFDPNHIGLSREDVHFELTLPDKLARIGAAGCTHFIDDLPELLAEPAFPRGVARLLFDPAEVHTRVGGFLRVSSWTDLSLGLRAA
jgi:hypothetical protein